MHKNVFLEINDQSGSHPRTWATACIRGPKHAYVGTFLCMWLGFQKYGNDKFSAIMGEVWNESHIV